MLKRWSSSKLHSCHVFSIGIKRTDDFLVFVLLHKPKKVLIELDKSLLDCSFPRIFWTILNRKDDFINNFHDKLCVVFLVKYQLLLNTSELIHSFFEGEILWNSEVISVNEIVFFVVCPINFIDDLSHSLSSPSWRGDRVVVRYVAHDAVQYVVNFNSQILF